MKKWTTPRIVFWIAVLLGAIVAFEFHWMLHRKREAHMGEALVRNPPWLMWGSQQTLKLQLKVGTSEVQGQQLVKIAYKRPETWRFLFFAQVLGVPYPIASNIHTPAVQLTIDFNVQTGIGRDQANIVFIPGTIPGSEQHGFLHFVIAGAPVLPNARKWATQTLGPPLDDTAAAPVPLNITDQIVGQDIQVNVRVQASSSSSFSDPLVLQVGAFFSPNVHIRPEWWKGKMGQEEDEGH